MVTALIDLELYIMLSIFMIVYVICDWAFPSKAYLLNYYVCAYVCI